MWLKSSTCRSARWMTMAEPWWKNSTALIWNRCNESHSCYWRLPPLDATQESGVIDSASADFGLYKLSYGHFTQLVHVLVQELRGILANVLSRDASLLHKSDIGDAAVLSVSVAVAIPEGPYLPIAVTAVHALNEPFSVSKSSVSVSAVLFPLDPSDGRVRILHMLGEIRPVVILTAADADSERIVESVNNLPTLQQAATAEVLYRASVVSVVNVQDILERSTQESKLALDLSSEKFDGISSVLPRPFENHGGTNRLSHAVYTSGTTGLPKACLSSIRSLRQYLASKNETHCVTENSTVLLASALTFDPCLSDILATILVRGTLAIAPRRELVENLAGILHSLAVTHLLCTPTLWSTLSSIPVEDQRFSCLRVVVLGGEHIPKAIVNAWARRGENDDDADTTTAVRLFATYGVTEACVYQTMGEVVWNEENILRHDVGKPFAGMGIRVCLESRPDDLVDVVSGSSDGMGEIVLFGNQLDEYSSYFLRPELTAQKFVSDNGIVHYRTGDRGFLHETTGKLSVLGRIEGEDGMVKINGVRTELGGIEAALVDSDECSAVVDAIMVVAQHEDAAESRNELHAYIVLSAACLAEMGLSSEIPSSGAACTESPLLTLLHERCKATKTVPSAFVIIPRVPLSPTGKRYRLGVPPFEGAVPLHQLTGLASGISIPLHGYGRTGSFVAQEISSCLNLRPSQVAFLTTTSTFAMLGGDSLAATRVARAIYARHHDIVNSRLIGGEFGILEGPFSAIHLLQAGGLGDYVDFLDRSGVFENLEPCRNGDVAQDVVDPDSTSDGTLIPADATAQRLYDALLQAATTKCTSVAVGLLDVGADPNFGENGGRIGKTSGRMERMRTFQSSPLHLACLHGDPALVRKLLDKGAKFNSPNASSLFPLHLAAAGEFHETSTDEEDERRLMCLRYLLDAGTSVAIRDGSKQTVLHAAARAGHVKVLRFALERWIDHFKSTSSLDLRDNWSRTPVHWAVLNGKVDALDLLIGMGCSANPAKPKDSLRRTSAAVESPLEMCSRLYSIESPIGQRMRSILNEGKG